MKKRSLFGTDGIRGKANVFPMTCEVATALGRAVTFYFQEKAEKQRKKPLIIVGKDTRLSCYMLEQAFSAGVCSQGGEVILTGPLPTPGVAFVTGSMRAIAGVMISASHNSFDDNGIKIFNEKGFKLPDDVELELERIIANPEVMTLHTGAVLGNTKRLKEVFGRYVVQTKAVLPAKYDLEGLRIVLDCANGAGYKVAPMVFSELGAEVIPYAISPNGTNINDNCGALYPENTQQMVEQYRADLGVCLDGDADRLVIVDDTGAVVEGDKLIALSAKLLMDQGVLRPGDTVVGTVMSNLGLEHYIKKLGLKFYRTQVGDRYIMEYMRSSGALLGGEPSGHIIFGNHATTGDGTLAALKMIECMKYYKKSIRDLVKDIALFPQVLRNTVVHNKIPLESVDVVQKVLKKVEAKIGANGRILLRYSGTEPLARVMVEGVDQDLIEKICNELIGVITKELGEKP